MRNSIIFVATLSIGMLCVFGSSSNERTPVETFRLLNSGLALDVYKEPAHLFLAEYDLKLVLKAGKTELDSANMTGDTGGLSRINVSKENESTIVFRDHAKTVCLDVARKRFNECDSVSSGNQIGYFDFDSKRKWRFVSRSEVES